MITRGYKSYFKEYWALKNVNLEIKKGETFGIVGRNGSGKSTLLQIIAGTLKATTGNVEVHGRVAALLELGSGFNPEFTGKENVYLNAAILGLSNQEVDTLYEDIVRFADIGDYINQPVKTYSSGMEVRLAFAVQAMVPKEILIVDEALAVGDELFQRKCFANIEEFKKNGGTVLFVSHSGGTVIELCDRAMLLDMGESLIIASSKQVVNLYQKMLYAPPEDRDVIKNEIREIASRMIGDDSPNISIGDVDSKIAKDYRPHSMYDPYMIPVHKIEYAKNGVEIFEAYLTDLEDERVNILIRNKKYKWKFKARFLTESKNVRFGMLIKTASGFDLGGAASAKFGQGIPLVKQGEIISVEFEFLAFLNTGTYFLNAGVLGTTDEGEVYLDRAIDAAAFKIIPDSDSLTTAVVDFDISSCIKVL
jgi:lipopolysaccharide transport system ATP-binding protein